MTDDIFETRFRLQVGRYADGGVRPIDAHAIALATLATRHRASPANRIGSWQRDQLRLTPRLAMLALLTVLAIAIAFVIVVVGQQSKEHQQLVDRPEVTAPAIAPSQPVASAPVDAPSVGRMAYVQGGDVYVAASDGSSAVKVLDDPGIDLTGVRWLSDGRHVVVEGSGLDTVVDLTTGDHHRLEIPPDAARWRDGTDEVAFMQPATAGRPAALVVVNALTGARREIAIDRGVYPLAWSADGSHLGGVNANDLVRIDAATGSSEVVATAPGDPNQIAWSPDLERITFVVNPDIPCDMTTKTCRSASEIYAVDTTTGAVPKKIAGPLAQGQLNGDNTTETFGPSPMPAWSADGEWIAYRTATGLALVHPDGSASHEILKGHVGAYAWDPDGAGIQAIMTAAIDGSVGDLVRVDTETGTSEPEGVQGISQLPPTSVGPAIDRAWAIEPESSSGTAAGPVAWPGTSPAASPPTSHRLVVQTSAACGRALEVDLDTGASKPIGSCVQTVAGDGRHLVDDHAAIDLLDGTSVPVAGRHGSSPSGRWLISLPEYQPGSDAQAAAQPTWDVATWDGVVRFQVPRPWWNPTNGPTSPSWSPDDSVVIVQTEQAKIRVDLTTGEQLTLPTPRNVWARPVGGHLYYIRDGDVWVAEADGSDERNISRFGFGGAHDFWLLPDGETLAVLQGQAMWLIGPDGGRRSINLGPVANPDTAWRGVSWSPDGRWFAASVHRDQTGVLSHTTFYSIDGSRIAEADGGDVSWSPDGQHAAVQVLGSEFDPVSTTARQSKVNDRVMLVDRGGRVATVANAWSPTWSPDSSRLVVYTSSGTPSGGVVDVLAPDGTGRRTITSRAMQITSMNWIPDR